MKPMIQLFAEQNFLFRYQLSGFENYWESAEMKALWEYKFLWPKMRYKCYKEIKKRKMF